jgi:hypothetical protein
MKRSEAILSLSEKLQKSQNLLDGYKNGSVTLKCLCDNLATRAVDYCIGSLRMLPPESSRSIKFGMYDLQHTQYAHVWDEDDTEFASEMELEYEEK